MSRAFVKESEAPEARCACGSEGVPVERRTLEAQLPPELASAFHGGASYCDSPGCDVAYFDGFGTRAGRERLAKVPWPKDPEGALCSCFGTTVEQVEDWARSGDKAAARAFLAQVEANSGGCGTRAPDGRPCALAVRKVFLRALGHRDSGE